MKTKQFQVTEHCYASAYLHEPISGLNTSKTEYPVVVIFPGGGYEYCSLREADPVAFEYFAAGFNVVLVHQYSVKENASQFHPVLEAGKIIMTIRSHAKQWHCRPDQIAVCGFSAGGHLAASSGTMWNHPFIQQELNAFHGENRPDAMILCYPVIRADQFAHEGSLKRVSGALPEQKEYQFYDIRNHVDEMTCPAFLWHTVTDQSVPVENTLGMMMELQNHHISYECHIFPEGSHGMSVCTEEVGSFDLYVQRWMDMSIKWLYHMFNHTK